ncbi:hypothetical protein HDIA_3884 [Hartmannibacter diazotrophicus]|uniref:Uncharacterized protein n=1 Tax=Hartmannibacter diazotrophicus TaxID=1482074 RepID=A0A2C9DCT6_9HYPH|nr:hypothetical protein [Hartmannibacter diazotrophicus]SON57425.1 hypothetical protein HDIA_3884 [Hartmannibacter diazotrophicus]
MVEFFSKSSEPRREDAHMRRVLEQNRSTITRLADQFSNGAYSASKQPREEPKAEGLIIHALSGPVRSDVAEPHVRVSVNGRVIVMDLSSGRQLHHLGEIRRIDGERRFRLATRENGFFSPVDGDISGALADLDDCRITPDFPEPRFVEEIGQRLGYGGPAE